MFSPTNRKEDLISYIKEADPPRRYLDMLRL